MEITEQGTYVISPIQFIKQEPIGRLPAPLVRVTCCGMMTLEVLIEIVSSDPPMGRYEAVSTHTLRGRGAVPALMLLKLLVSQPHRFATKDWLSTQMQQEMEVGSLVRLDTMASQLRTLFRGLECEETSAIRLLLVEYLRNGRGSGPGYRLAPYPLIWLDSEALAWNVEQAARMERFGEDALPWWERAYVLASRGAYLPDDPYSEWAIDKRAEVEGALRQCVHALSRLYLSQGRRGEEEAIRLLRSYWLTHQTDEDALRPLLELLGKRECYQEAEQYYQLLCEALDAIERGKQPDARTRDLHAFLRLKQLQRPSSSSLVPDVEEERSFSATSPQETRVVEATGSPLSDDQEFLLLADKPSDHAGPLLAETRHLLGRQEWLASIIAQIQAEIPKKLLVLHGPIGVGKSSELNRLAHAFVEQNTSQVIVLSLPAREPRDPEASLDLFVGMLLSESSAAPFPADASRQMRIKLALTTLAERPQRSVILLDNAEGTLTEEGTLAACWEAFLSRIVRAQHQAALILASKEWPGWTGRDPQLVAEIPVPPLTLEDSVLLLQRLGLESVPHAGLETISQRVGCIPLCLEWIAKIAHDPLVHDAWEGFEELEETSTESRLDATAQRLTRLLQHPTLLGEHLAIRLMPLLQYILERHLSDEARLVLNRLAVATLPLGKKALQVICPRPRLLKELRNASLLAAYTNRIQLLPIVALTIRQQLRPEQRQEVEAVVIQMYNSWLDEGNVQMQEAGSVVTELTVLLLTHHRLLDAAQLLIRYSWLSFKLGHGPRLAIIARDELHRFDWHRTGENECAGLVIVQLLFPLLGKPVDVREHVDYQRIRDGLLAGKIVLQAAVDQYVTHLLLLDAMNRVHFEEAQGILDAYRTRVAVCQAVDLERNPGWLMEQAFFLVRWCEYLEEQGERQQAHALREQAITLYKQRIALSSLLEKKTSLSRDLHKRALAYCFCSLSCHLNRAGYYEEALQVTERAITLQEQGYVFTSTLAASYGEKSQILMALGRFQEALLFDEKAVAEIQRWADAGDGLSQSEAPIYQVNRGRLYLRLGRVNEAELALQEALPRISAQRRTYRMFAHEALEEMKQWRQKSRVSEHQLDWRWAERFRDLIAHDSFWWLTWAGPFTEEEQQAWDRLFALPLDETTRARLGTLMKEPRERELKVAFEEQREPRLQYPAIAIEDVRYRINALQQLDADIGQQEPNAIVRRLYQGAIAEDVDYLRLIEATYEGNTERFWECNLRVFPLPNIDEMKYALAYVKRIIHQGLASPETAAISQQLQEFMHTYLHLSSDLTEDDIRMSHEIQQTLSNTYLQPQRRLAVQTVKRFFETVLRESGYAEWQVVIDPNATGARIEQGLHVMFLPDQQFTLEEMKHLLMHELAGHTARIMAGEHSLLGLLGIHTKNYMPTEEGLALYHEYQEELRHGRRFDDAGIRLITLGIGLASGVMTPPQTFRSVVTFFELLASLRLLLKRPNTERQKVQTQARSYALSLGLRIYRGVPDLECPGVCFLQDTMYVRGIRLIEQVVAEDETVLDRLAVGVCAVEQLPDLQELGIVAPPQALRKLATASDLDAYILSFDVQEDQCAEET